jgi:hypothetical protein
VISIQVGHVYYVDKDIDRIVTYCEKILLPEQNILRLRREDLLIEDEIIHVKAAEIDFARFRLSQFSFLKTLPSLLNIYIYKKICYGFK